MLTELDDFLLHLQANNYSPRTVYNYERDLRVFDRFLMESKLDFPRLSKRDITYYKAYLSSRDRETAAGVDAATSLLDARSINRMLSALRSYLRYLIDRDLPCPLAPDAVDMSKTTRKHPQVAELDALTSLVESPTQFESDPKISLRNRAMLEMLLSTGMRITGTSCVRASPGSGRSPDSAQLVAPRERAHRSRLRAQGLIRRRHEDPAAHVRFGRQGPRQLIAPGVRPHGRLTAQIG